MRENGWKIQSFWRVAFLSRVWKLWFCCMTRVVPTHAFASKINIFGMCNMDRRPGSKAPSELNNEGMTSTMWMTTHGLRSYICVVSREPQVKLRHWGGCKNVKSHWKFQHFFLFFFSFSAIYSIAVKMWLEIYTMFKDRSILLSEHSYESNLILIDSSTLHHLTG